MRDEYYDDIDDIEIDDIDEEWLDEEFEESAPAPAPRRRVEEPRRRERRIAARDVDAYEDEEPRKGVLGRFGKSFGREDTRRSTHRDREDRLNRSVRRGEYRRAEHETARDRRAERPAQTPAASAASPVNDLILLLFKIGLVAAFLIFMTTFFFGITQQRDTSMEPAIKEGDIVIYYRPDKDYAVGDAIVVDYNGKLQVRRVVATAGDTVDISADGGLIVNGSTQFEDDIYTQTYPYTEGITFPVTVGTGEVFVLGDDRTSAEDSRMYGTVSISATKGAVMTVIRRRGI